MSAKKTSGSNDPESKRTGGTCGEFVGCLVILLAVIGVLFWFVAKPKLEDAGYPVDSLYERAREFTKGLVRRADGLKDKVGKGGDQAREFKDTVESTTEKIRDDAREMRDRVRDAGENYQERYNLPEPELIEG